MGVCAELRKLKRDWMLHGMLIVGVWHVRNTKTVSICIGVHWT